MPNVTPLSLPDDKLDDLANLLLEKFQLSKNARATQVDDKALRWEKNYDAIPAQEVRTTPFYRASNFMPQMIRMHCDILGARILGIIFGTKPFWMPKTLMRDQVPHEILEALGLGINYIWDTDLAGFETTDEIVNQSLQTGTLILKGLWSDETRSHMDADGAFQEIESQKMEYEPIAFEDFWPYPISAKNCRKAEIMFHRIRLTARDVEDRKQSKRWDEAAASLMQPSGAVDALDEARAQSSGIVLTPDVSYPFTAIECWLDYDIDGKRRPIVVVLNPAIKGRQSVLKAYYNFMPYGERPFVDFTPMPRRGSFFGYSVPEILEQSQEEQAQIHNGRRDANTIANIPGWKKKRYAEVPNPATSWYPGCVIELDEMDDLEMMAVALNYNSMIDEEQFLMSLAERYIGISPSMQGFGAGQSAGKRGVYSTGGTLALLSEGNRRLDIFIRRLRYPFHRIGALTAQAYNQFAPNYWDKFGEQGNAIKQAFKLAGPNGGLLYDLAASEASSNREIDRQNLLQMANVMANYYEKIIELGGAMRQLPPEDPLRPVALMVLDGARDLANRLLFAFDQGDRNRLLPDATKVLGGGAGQKPTDRPGRVQSAPGDIPPSELEGVLKNIAAVSGGAAG